MAEENIRIPTKDQNHTCMFEMSLRFKADIGSKTLNDIMDKLGDSPAPVLRDSMILHIDQTVPFIPDDEVLKKYEAILLSMPPQSDAAIKNIKFDGYEYIHAVQAPKTCNRTILSDQLQAFCRTDLLDCASGCSGCPVQQILDALERANQNTKGET